MMRLKSRASAMVTGAVAIFIIGMAATIGPHLVHYGEVGVLTNPADFRAFYCAGAVVASHGDPTTIEPLRTCEQRTVREMGLQPFPLMVNAAPQPPYALIAFAVFSFLPFAAASCAWVAILLLCTIATIRLLRYLCGLPPIVVTLAIIGGNLLAIMSGELGPVVLFALVLAAHAIRLRRPGVATASVAIASIVPHVALPVWIALLVFRKETRLWLCAYAVAFAIFPSLVFGPTVWLAYLVRELPIHALSEVHALHLQYSLTMALAAVGVSDHGAILLGQVQYGFMIALGVFVADRLARRVGKPELLVLLPPAFAAFGGVFIHLYQLVIIVPAALCLASIGPKMRWAMIGAIVFVFGGIVLYLGLESSLREGIGQRYFEGMRQFKPGDLASATMKLWHDNQETSDPGKIREILMMKIPAVAGLLVFIIACLTIAFGGKSSLRGWSKSGVRDLRNVAPR
ncbi:MAG: DUF2029 domain-containing protein [Candidatus Eremiobacteraeota bacterium]|nr:DUF2029 domain-containing protein [Candidatus Eremiobacteraeota bacterium]